MTRREDLATDLALAYSRPEGDRNPDWDWEAPDSPDNPFYLEKPMSDRIKETPFIVSTASDGGQSIRGANFLEIADVLLAAGWTKPADA